MKSMKIISYADNYNLNKEWAGYRYKTDNDDKVMVDSRGKPTPIKIKDDAISALRYALYSHSKQANVKIAFI